MISLQNQLTFYRRKYLKYARPFCIDFIFYNYYYFLKVNFRLQPKVCNGCHDSMQKTMSFNDIAIISGKENYYRIQFWYMSKEEAINIMKNSDLKNIYL